MKIKLSLLFLLLATSTWSQIPILNSNPAATTKVIYLDFDGQIVSGTAWNGGNTINALPSTASSAGIINIWKRVSEDYIPFDVNVTTDSVRFNNALPNRRIRVVFTPTSAWYGSAGGVAYVNSFTWGGTPGTPCWVFENQLGYNVKNMAEAAAHEAGHTLGLRHQSIYNSSCVKTDEYHPGTGSGVTSWAPIMGIGYSRNVTVWHNGRSATGCNIFQLDHGNGNPGITNSAFLSFKPDDIGNNFGAGKFLALNNQFTVDSGLITTPSDIDVFRFTICSNRYVGIHAKPFALDTINYSGANLDIRLHLYDEFHNLLAVDTSLTRLHAQVGLNLNPGTYYFVIDGGRSNNYSDYGSLGRYYLRIKATNPPSLISSFATNSICAGQNVVLNPVSNQQVSGWQWTVSSTSTFSNFSVQQPTVNFTSGTYSIQLVTSNSTATSCVYTHTMSVGPSPVLNANILNPFICPGGFSTINMTGANNYTINPGNSTGSVFVVYPTAPTTYTINGSNGSCSSSMTAFVDVSSDFTIGVTASHTLLCSGDWLTLSGQGAENYTFSPGNVEGPFAVFSPTSNTNFTITGQVGQCVKNIVRPVTVIPDFTLNLTADDYVCNGEQIIFYPSGANLYTVLPVNITKLPLIFTPTVTGTYTLLGANNPACVKETIHHITVLACDVGLNKMQSALRPSLYPNPAKEKITIDVPESGRIRIYSVNGALIRDFETETGNSYHIPVNSWSKGLYYIMFTNQSGDSGAGKVLIE